jgi:SnoaL-like domain
LYRGARPARDGSVAVVGRAEDRGYDVDKELQELVDRRAIDDLLLRYSTALDTRQFDLLDHVFTADAQIDYATSGGIKGNREDLKRWFREEAFTPFTSWQHHLTNMAVELDGDTATGRTSVYNPLAFIGEDGGGAVLHVGAWYDDRFARTPDGWRITERSLGMAWTDGPFPATVPALPDAGGSAP